MKVKKKRELTKVDYEAVADELLLTIADAYPEDFDYIRSHIRMIIEDPSSLKKLLKYKHMPVGPREFMESPAYMKKKDVLWPRVMDEFIELNSGRYNEAVVTGAIGVGKTQMALYTQAYQLYLISCLRNPHQEFDLDEASEIIIVFQSLNASLAQGVDYERFRQMISTSPYFEKHFPYDKGILSELRFPHGIKVKPISGQDTGAIGQNVIGGIIDEINFMAVTEGSKHSKDGEVYDQAVKNYNSISSRRASRFMQLGALPGMLCLVSSRNYPGQFTDKKEEEARKNPLIFVYDKRLWEIRPERFCGDTFWTFIGDATRKPYLDAKPERLKEEDQHLCMAIPVEYRNKFENDLLNSLREIAGVSTLALHPFFLNTDAVAAVFNTVPSILSREDCDFVTTKVAVLPKRIRNKNEPRLCHVDLAYSKDSAAISCGHVVGFQKIKRGEYIESLPLVEFDFVLEVKVPAGGEIEFENIRKLLYTLRDKVGLPIKWVTFDGFQSRDSMQLLFQQGFIVHYASLDKTTEGYDFFKQAIYDGRVKAPPMPLAQKEIISLEINVKDAVVDHPPNGSKDVADTMAGVVYGLTILREIWSRWGIPTQQIPLRVQSREPPKSATKIRQGGGKDIEVDNDADV